MKNLPHQSQLPERPRSAVGEMRERLIGVTATRSNPARPGGATHP